MSVAYLKYHLSQMEKSTVPSPANNNITLRHSNTVGRTDLSRMIKCVTYSSIFCLLTPASDLQLGSQDEECPYILIISLDLTQHVGFISKEED